MLSEVERELLDKKFQRLRGPHLKNEQHQMWRGQCLYLKHIEEEEESLHFHQLQTLNRTWDLLAALEVKCFVLHLEKWHSLIVN